jgi:hypothetical protein
MHCFLEALLQSEHFSIQSTESKQVSGLKINSFTSFKINRNPTAVGNEEVMTFR